MDGTAGGIKEEILAHFRKYFPKNHRKSRKNLPNASKNFLHIGQKAGRRPSAEDGAAARCHVQDSFCAPSGLVATKPARLPWLQSPKACLPGTKKTKKNHLPSTGPIDFPADGVYLNRIRTRQGPGSESARHDPGSTFFQACGVVCGDNVCCEIKLLILFVVISKKS